MPDEARTKCKSCAASILPATSERFDGYCAPCYKELNAIPYIPPPQPPQSFLSKLLGYLAPVFFIGLVFVGFPLGYKLILGGSRSTVTSGVIKSIYLTHPISDPKLEGRQARIVADYLIVEMEGGRKLWISEENLVGVEFESED
jgi:hypothetical protein